MTKIAELAYRLPNPTPRYIIRTPFKFEVSKWQLCRYSLPGLNAHVVKCVLKCEQKGSSNDTLRYLGPDALAHHIN